MYTHIDTYQHEEHKQNSEQHKRFRQQSSSHISSDPAVTSADMQTQHHMKAWHESVTAATASVHTQHVYSDNASLVPAASTSKTSGTQMFMDALVPVRSVIHAYLSDLDVCMLSRCHHIMFIALVCGYHIRAQLRLRSWNAISDTDRASKVGVKRMPANRGLETQTEKPMIRYRTLPSYLLVSSLWVVCQQPLPVLRLSSSLERNAADVIVDLQSASGLWDIEHKASSSILSTLTELVFGAGFDYILAPGTLPASVTHLTLGHAYNRPLLSDILPVSLTHLKLGYGYKLPISAGALPDSLTHLTFGFSYNQPLASGVLPASLTHLTFGYSYDQPIAIGVLPASLTHLTFGHAFNQPILIGALPTSLTHLTFGHRYEHLSASSTLR